MKVSKKTNEIDFEAYLLFPTFEWNRKVKAIKGEQRSTFFNLPVFFNLTTQENVFIVEICLVIGLGIKLQLLEN